jgi:hypothetical protein
MAVRERALFFSFVFLVSYLYDLCATDLFDTKATEQRHKNHKYVMRLIFGTVNFFTLSLFHSFTFPLFPLGTAL